MANFFPRAPEKSRISLERILLILGRPVEWARGRRTPRLIQGHPQCAEPIGIPYVEYKEVQNPQDRKA